MSPGAVGWRASANSSSAWRDGGRWSKLVACLSELVLICWVQELVAEGDGKGGAKEAPAFRNGQLSERGAGYGRALSGCGFCGSCKSGDKEWLAAEECVAEVVASGLVL